MALRSNPALRDSVFSARALPGFVMTISGTINKAFLLFAITVLGVLAAWSDPAWSAWCFNNWKLLIIVNLALGVVSCWQPVTSPVIAPIYCFFEGLLIGFITPLLEKNIPA